MLWTRTRVFAVPTSLFIFFAHFKVFTVNQPDTYFFYPADILMNLKVPVSLAIGNFSRLLIFSIQRLKKYRAKLTTGILT
jgi:hypothetical protein